MRIQAMRYVRSVGGRVRRRSALVGMLVGAAIVVSAMAVAQSSAGWFAGLFSTGGAGSGAADTTLISQQDSVVATEINADAANCAQGAPGTVGAAIQTAMLVHENIAAATPQTESLFDPSSSCFASVSQLFDLSFAIPSIASILTAAENAVLQYAQKKVCTAVSQVTGMVTSPINLAISDVNNLPGFSTINGMPGSSMALLNPQLGAQYQPTGSGGNYTTNTNPFNTGQTTFTPGTGSGSGGTQLGDTAAQLNALTQQIAAEQITVNQDQVNLQNAQLAYSACASGSGCTAEFNALQAAQQTLLTDQAALITLQEQLGQLVTQSGNVVPSPPVMTPNVATQLKAEKLPSSSTPRSSTSWWSDMSKLFN